MTTIVLVPCIAAVFLQKDVPSDLAKAFLDKLSAPMCALLDYVIDLQLVVFTLMFSMKAFQLGACSGSGFQVKKAHSLHIPDILPAGFTRKTNVTRFAPSLPSSALKSAAFFTGVQDLFQERHINYLHSYFYGERGAKASHPAFDALSAANKPTLDAITVSNAPRSNNELMKIALALYMTNLKNMWVKNKLFNRALSKLLEILLHMHLAPKRETHYQQLKQKRAKNQDKKMIVK